VGSDANTVPYNSDVFQDKSITWDIDTDIAISRTIDSGNIDDINDLSKTVSIEGTGVKTYAITR